MSARLRGPRRMVDATETLQHLDQLRADGMSYAQIGRASGINPGRIHELRRRAEKDGRARVLVDTALAILAIPSRDDPAATPPAPLVPPPAAGWQDAAACRAAEPEIFYDPAMEHEARLYCSICRVRADCLNDALNTEPRANDGRYGFRAGLTPEQRAREYERRRKARRKTTTGERAAS